MSEAMWSSKDRKANKKARKAKRLLNKQKVAKYRMHYELVFDGGGQDFDLYYRTLFGARLGDFYWRHIRSWGGWSELYAYTHVD